MLDGRTILYFINMNILNVKSKFNNVFMILSKQLVFRINTKLFGLYFLRFDFLNFLLSDIIKQLLNLI